MGVQGEAKLDAVFRFDQTPNKGIFTAVNTAKNAAAFLHCQGTLLLVPTLFPI